MATFSLIGDTEPFLHCRLNQGETIHCESDAMVMMEDGLELTGQMRGGLFQSLARRLATGESLFQQKITATHAGGDCLLAPKLNGDIQIIDVGETQYRMNDGAFVACSDKVNVKASVQRNLGGALFGDNGGFVIMCTEGVGQLAVTGMGVIFAIDIEPGKTTTIDNGHVVCWDASLQYSLSTSVNRSRGLLGNLMNSVTSGEGFVLKFQGQGKVYLSSRNPSNFRGWLQTLINGSGD